MALGTHLPRSATVDDNRSSHVPPAVTTDGAHLIIKTYGRRIAIAVQRFGPHAARATAATSQLVTDQLSTLIRSLPCRIPH